MKKYRILHRIGDGATAVIYLVESMENGHRYAMKCSDDHELLKYEAEILKKIKGKYFPHFYEYLPDNNSVIMEYVEGRNLQEILDSGKKFELGEIVFLVEEVLNALSNLHCNHPGIVYRDLKPANIMLEKSGRVRLIDFGAAFVLEAEKRNQSEREIIKAGTYGYGAPEQFWRGVIPDIRCDIYAVGKVLAYLLSGKNPAIPPYNMEQLCKGVKGIQISFQRILERSLATNPLARYEDCISMRRDLRKAYEESGRKELFKLHKKTSLNYIKCIWLSEYRRIF